jgi:ribosomal protein S12
MKLAIGMIVGLVSVISFSARAASSTHEEVRTRQIGETITAVGQCSRAIPAGVDFQAPIVRQDGTTSVDRNGNVRFQMLTHLTATSSVPFQKCVVSESYKVTVTGGGMMDWNPQVTEIPGSAVRTGRIVVGQNDSTKVQDANLRKVSNAAGGGIAGQILIEAVSSGVMAQAMNDCAAARQNLMMQRRDQSQTDCR